MRRARIKVTANLSATRRTANKTNADKQNATKETDNEIDSKSQENNVNSPSQPETTVEISQPLTNEGKSSIDSTAIDCASSPSENFLKLNEKSSESDPVTAESAQKQLTSDTEAQPSPQNEPSTFKTPMQMPRAEIDSAGTSSSSQPSTSSSKFRRFKIAPRLNTSRNVAKPQVSFNSTHFTTFLQISVILGN